MSIKDIYYWLKHDFRSKLLTEGGSLNILGKLIKVFGIYIFIRVAYYLLSRLIETTMRHRKGSSQSLSYRRVDTIVALVRKTIKFLLYFYGTLMALEVFNIDTKSILATAGIGGVAIGFGAQSLVKDMISGFFILQENSYVIGDHIKADGKEGIVEEMGLRITKVRDFNGDLHIIPNGRIATISNMSRGAKRALVIISIAYEENLDRAIGVLNRMLDEIREEDKDILVSGPDIDGVESLGDSGVDIRISAMTKSGEQWGLERKLRKRSKECLEASNIEIPYSKLVVIKGEEDDTKI